MIGIRENTIVVMDNVVVVSNVKELKDGYYYLIDFDDECEYFAKVELDDEYVINAEEHNCDENGGYIDKEDDSYRCASCLREFGND